MEVVGTMHVEAGQLGEAVSGQHKGVLRVHSLVLVSVPGFVHNSNLFFLHPLGCSMEGFSQTKPPGSHEFSGFGFGKNQERASKFDSVLGRDRGLVNNCSAPAGRAPNWTGSALL